MQISTFTIAGESFAVPALLVEEFFRPLPVTRVPGADPRIDGMVSIRGRTAVVVNLRKCFGKFDPHEDRQSEMILLETSAGLVKEALEIGLYALDEPVVLRVDEATQIYTLTDEHVHPPPPHVSQEFVEGVVQSGQKYFTMISVRKLINCILNEHDGEMP